MDNNQSITTTFIVRKIIFNNYLKNGNFQFKPEISAGVIKLADNEWETSVNVKVLNKEETPFPFDLDVVVSLVTKFNGQMPGKDELIQYLKFGSLNILFPYVRSVVTNVSSAAMVAPLLLPLMDLNQFAKNITIPGLEDLSQR